MATGSLPLSDLLRESSGGLASVWMAWSERLSNATEFVSGPGARPAGAAKARGRALAPGQRRAQRAALIKYGSIRQCSGVAESRYSRLVPSCWRMAGAVLLRRASRRRTAKASLTSWRIVPRRPSGRRLPRGW
jgi:hypothetical protein